MAVTVTRTQIRTVLSGPTYRVQDTCSASVGIAKEIYVFNVADDSFVSVATVHDVITYPANKAAAAAAGQSKYRAAQVTRDFTNLDTAVEFAASLPIRAKALCVAYGKAVGEFQGSTTEVIGVTP